MDTTQYHTNSSLMSFAVKIFVPLLQAWDEDLGDQRGTRFIQVCEVRAITLVKVPIYFEDRGSGSDGDGLEKRMCSPRARRLRTGCLEIALDSGTGVPILVHAVEEADVPC